MRYDIQVSDPEAFTITTRRNHVLVFARWPGCAASGLHTPEEWSDTWPVNRGGAVLMAELEYIGNLKPVTRCDEVHDRLG